MVYSAERRENVLEEAPIFGHFANANTMVAAHVLLEYRWQRLSDKARDHARTLGVLRRPVSRKILDGLGDSTDELFAAHLLTPVKLGNSPHSKSTETWRLEHVVQEYVRCQLTPSQRQWIHRLIALVYHSASEQQLHPWLYRGEAIHHFCSAREGDAAWPLVQEQALWMQERGHVASALDLLERCTEAGVTGENRAEALAWMAQIGRKLDLDSEAVASWLWSSADVTSDDNLLGSILSDLGLIYWDRGELSHAEAIWEEAAQRWISLGDRREPHPMAAVTLHRLGRVHSEQGRLDEAEATLKRALTMAIHTADQPNSASVVEIMHDLANVWRSGGELERARELLERCANLALGHSGDQYCGVVRALASVLEELGDVRGAQRALQQSITPISE